MPAITSTDLENAKTDVDHIAAIATSTAPTATDRLGHVKKTMAGASADVSASVAAVEASKNAAINTTIPGKMAEVEAAKNTAITTTIPGKMAEVEAAKNTAINTTIPALVALVDTAVAVTAAGASTKAKVAAEAARDAAQLSAGVYATTTAGLAATTNGQYFSVPSASSSEYLILYLNNAGVAVEVKRYPSASANDYLSKNLLQPGVAYTVADSDGRSVIQVLDDGLVQLGETEVESINGLSGDAINRASDFIDNVTSNIAQPGVAYAIADSSGKIVFQISSDGLIQAGDLVVSKLNGLTVESIGSGASIPEGNFTAELNFILAAGQSLNQLSVPSDQPITTTQEYDNIGFQAAAVSPTQYYPLTVANTQALDGGGVGRGESPMYGCLGHIKALILAENNLNYTDHDYQLLTCNNAHGGTAISEHVKGTSYYSAAISQVNAGLAIAQTEGRSYKFQAFTWAQGEADQSIGTSRLAYTTAFKQLVADINTDGKAITGQTDDVICISYQTELSYIGLAQLDAALEDPTRIYIATPTYFMPKGDGTHLTPIGAKWMGGYFGLVYKRVVIDKQEWKPVSVCSIFRQGRVINARFHVPVPPLVLDTASIQLIPNYGFQVVDSVGATIPISTVELVERDTVKITTSATVPAGSKLRYAYIGTATGKGNLRDSQGDTLIYEAINKPMHNWGIMFEVNI